MSTDKEKAVEILEDLATQNLVLAERIKNVKDHFNSAVTKISALREMGRKSSLPVEKLSLPSQLAELITKLFPNDTDDVKPNLFTWFKVKGYKDQIQLFLNAVVEMKQDKNLFETLLADPLYYHLCLLFLNLQTEFSKELPAPSLELMETLFTYLGSGDQIKELSPDSLKAIFEGVNIKLSSIVDQIQEHKEKQLRQLKANFAKADIVIADESKLNDQKMEELGPYILEADRNLRSLTDFEADQESTDFNDYEQKITYYTTCFFDCRSKSLREDLQEIEDELVALNRDEGDEECVQKIVSCTAEKDDFEKFYKSLLSRIDQLDKVAVELKMLRRGMYPYYKLKDVITPLFSVLPKNTVEFDFCSLQVMLNALLEKPPFDRELYVATKVASQFSSKLDVNEGDKKFTHTDYVELEKILETKRFEELRKQFAIVAKLNTIFDNIKANHLKPNLIPLDDMQYACDNIQGSPEKAEWAIGLKDIALRNVKAAHDIQGEVDFGARAERNTMVALAEVEEIPVEADDGFIARTKKRATNTFRRTVAVAGANLKAVGGRLDEKARWDLPLAEIFQHDKEQLTLQLREAIAQCLIEKITSHQERINDYIKIDAVLAERKQLYSELMQYKNSTYFDTDQQRQRVELLISNVDDFINLTTRWILRVIDALARAFKIKEHRLPHDLIAMRAARKYKEELTKTLNTSLTESEEETDPVSKNVNAMVKAQQARLDMSRQKTNLQKHAYLHLQAKKGLFGDGRESKNRLRQIVAISDLTFRKVATPEM